MTTLMGDAHQREAGENSHSVTESHATIISTGSTRGQSSKFHVKQVYHVILVYCLFLLAEISDRPWSLKDDSRLQLRS